MGSDELNRISGTAEWYLNDQLDFDRRLIHFRYQTIKPHLKGPEGLELGPAEGQMTRFLVQDFKRLTVVDGTAALLNCIHDYSNVIKVHSLFEDFKADQ